MRALFQSISRRNGSAGSSLLAAELDNAVFSEIIEAAEEAVLITGPSGEVCYANRAYMTLFELRDTEVLPPSLVGLLNCADAQADRFYRLQKAAAEASRAEEMFDIDKQGTHCRLLISVAPIPSRQGFSIWRVRQVELPDAPESRDHRSSGRLYDMIDRVPVGYALVNGEGIIEFANKRFAQWAGRDSAQFVGQQITTREVFENDAILWPDEDAVESTGRTGIDRLVVMRPDGEKMPVSVFHQVRLRPDGRVQDLQLVMRDLRMNVALDPTRLGQTETRFLRLFDIAPVGIVIVETDASVLETNSTFFQDFSVSLSRGDDFLSVVSPDYCEDVRRLIADAVGLTPPDGHIDIELVDGENMRSTQLYASPLQEAGGASVVLYLVDTTEQKQLELQFAQSQKMQAVGQLAGGIAHDFNNLLTAIIGYSDLLLTRYAAGDPSFSDIHQIKQNANRAANLVRQLLAFSRQQTLRSTVFSVTDMLAELNNLLRRLLGQNIELTMTHGRNLGMVKADQGQLENVIINLAVNARDAMEGNSGALTIRTANISAETARALDHAWMPPGDCVMIEVSDDGPGIPKEIAGKIFEPFFTTKEVGKGTGLGLSTAYGIIKQQGGSIYVDSESGEGATFRIYLPQYEERAEQQQDLPAAEPERTDLTGQGVILLVEDEDPVRAFASRALASKGYTVLEANSGEAALEIVDEQSGEIDLVISDVVMPNMDGPTLIKNIQSKNPGIRAIFVSGYAEDAFRESDQPLGEYGFLPKPFTLKQLAARVKEVLGEG